MFISPNLYKVPLNENAWYVIKSLLDDRYYAFRKINGIKEKVYIGDHFDDAQKIENKLRRREDKLKLPKKLRTKFDDYVLIEVEPPAKKIKLRKSEHPKNTKWKARILRNGNTYAYYLYRKIHKRTHRFYLGANPDDKLIIKKITEYENKIDLEKKYKTKFNHFQLEMLDE